MIKAHIAFMTFPAPGRFVFNYKADTDGEIIQVEISQAHLANVIIDGASISLRESTFQLNRVPSASQTEGAHERTGASQRLHGEFGRPQ